MVWRPPIATGRHSPMSHQAEDVARLEAHPRICVFNGLGTGKTCLTAWWLQSLWHRGVIDEVVIVGPSMLYLGWMEAMTELAWPGELVDFIDARPPDHDLISEAMAQPCVTDPSVLPVRFTTYAGLRDAALIKHGRSRWARDVEFVTLAAGRRVALVVDEAQGVALPTSGQTKAAHALGSACAAVAAVTATPIGNPLHLRMWALCRLVRPDVLLRLPNPPVPGLGPTEQPEAGSFDAFKARYAFLVDPMERKGRRFRLSRAYPVDVHRERMRTEVVSAIASFTCRRAKEDCLDLPPKVQMTRSTPMDGEVTDLMVGLIEHDRAVLSDGHAVVPANILEERLRVLELSGGWLEGRPVHSLKLGLLRDTLAEIDEEIGPRAPRLVWAARTRPLLASALVACGEDPDVALMAGTTAADDSGEYAALVQSCRRRGVGLIHGPTPDRERDRIQQAWRAGDITTVVAHPAVAGAGLNWQHVRASVYYDQPLGTIHRQQSEDRVHRHGLAHTALYYDLVLEGGPDAAVMAAHRDQRDAERALLAWLARALA
jgi:hypothetical protein